MHNVNSLSGFFSFQILLEFIIIVIFIVVVIVDLRFPLCSGSFQHWFLVIGQHASFPVDVEHIPRQIVSEKITYGDESSFNLCKVDRRT